MNELELLRAECLRLRKERDDARNECESAELRGEMRAVKNIAMCSGRLGDTEGPCERYGRESEHSRIEAEAREYAAMLERVGEADRAAGVLEYVGYMGRLDGDR